VAIDLKQKQGKDLIKNLAKKADVVIENYRAGLVEAGGSATRPEQSESKNYLYQL